MHGIPEMVKKCTILHKMGPWSDLQLISLDWSGWLAEPTEPVRCVFHRVGERFVYGYVYPTVDGSEATTISSTCSWGMLG